MSTAYDFETTATFENGKPEPAPVVDNRLRLEVDPRRVESWELTVMESAKISDWLMVFARYAANGRGLLSPELPSVPLDEMTQEQREAVMKSAGYHAVKRFKIPQLREAVRSFSEQAVSGF